VRIAVFSDMHGKILLPFKLVDLYQKETGNKVDLILQCGDMGAYPTIENLDKATIRHAQHDRDELGFHDDFTKMNSTIKVFLDELNMNMICVRGNHEDHDFLDNLEKLNSNKSIFPIDIYERVWVCKSGLQQEFKVNNESLTLVGIGRIGDRKDRTEKRFIQEYEKEQVKKLLRSKGIFDILITHDKEGGSQRGYGMSEIREVLDNIVFHFHFYGHTGEPFKVETAINGITQSIKVKELEFDETGILSEGCMVILEKNTDGEFNLEIVDQRITNKLTKYNWKFN
jgi:predicted phosphodiesterase